MGPSRSPAAAAGLGEKFRREPGRKERASARVEALIQGLPRQSAAAVRLNQREPSECERRRMGTGIEIPARRKQTSGESPFLHSADA